MGISAEISDFIFTFAHNHTPAPLPLQAQIAMRRGVGQKQGGVIINPLLALTPARGVFILRITEIKARSR